MRRLLGLGLLAALGAVFALGAAPALGSHIQCGDVITQDTTLDSDLIDCPGNGIVIGSPDITVDLNGHTIDGDDSGLEDHGIDNGAGEDAVTVRGPGLQGIRQWRSVSQRELECHFVESRCHETIHLEFALEGHNCDLK